MIEQEEININNEKYILETGRWARQAGGSVVLKWGKLVLLSTACAEKKGKEDLDFFPLTVEYKDKYYAAGKIPGGYLKREGRPSDKQILTARMTDRPIRPLFPETFTNETQIFINLLSTDGKRSGDVHSITAASAALMISEIPFAGPVGGIRIGRVDGKWIIFPDNDELAKADINLALAGTKDAVTMIEGLSDEVSEEDMMEAIALGHKEIQRLCEMQIKLAKKINKEKLIPPPKEDFSELNKKIRSLAFNEMQSANKTEGKHKRQEAIDKLTEVTLEKLKTEFTSNNLEEKELLKKLKISKSILHDIEVEIVRTNIFEKGVRADNRKLDEIRDINVEVGVLPGAHGSAVFTRGETQALGVTTLGTDGDVQYNDDVDSDDSSKFYLHYNFPPFSVGEVRRITGTSRREVGHGKLAENALFSGIKKISDFPYTIRLVSEILESNGSSSMATVCAGSLSMMDAGVPIPRPVAGIAMGLMTSEDQKKFAILSDIAGLEDHVGDMDFKIAGTEKGITAFQLDTKVEGISQEIMKKTFHQAKEGRLHILGKMNDVIAKSRSNVAEHAPQITIITIPKDKIGELIGPGGKNIKALSESTKTEIFIDDDGTVKIASKGLEAGLKAKQIIEDQMKGAQVDQVYDGKVVRLTDFGAFIEIRKGLDGLCHISKISDQRVTRIEDVLSIGQIVKVKVIAIDRQGRISLSMKDVS